MGKRGVADGRSVTLLGQEGIRKGERETTRG